MKNEINQGDTPFPLSHVPFILLSVVHKEDDFLGQVNLKHGRFLSLYIYLPSVLSSRANTLFAFTEVTGEGSYSVFCLFVVHTICPAHFRSALLYCKDRRNITGRNTTQTQAKSGPGSGQLKKGSERREEVYGKRSLGG